MYAVGSDLLHDIEDLADMLRPRTKSVLDRLGVAGPSGKSSANSSSMRSMVHSSDLIESLPRVP